MAAALVEVFDTFQLHILTSNDRATLGRPFKRMNKFWVTFVNFSATFLGEMGTWQLS